MTRALPFTDFAGQVLGVQLTPGQRVVALVAFDGMDPIDLDGADRELARRIFGDVERVPADARGVVAAVCGARAGKTYVLCGLRLLHLGLTVPLTTLAPGELGVAVMVAPTLKLAQQTLGYVRGAVRNVPAIARLVEADSADSIVLARPDGPRVSLECIAAGARGAALRGRSLVGAVLDEAAMFRDAETGMVNDEEVYRAVAPRIVVGGQLIIASTPWAEVGLLHALWKANHGKPSTALVAHAPTLVLRNDEHTRAYVAREEQRDPANARREFGAEFMPGDATAFFDPRAVAAAVDPALVLPGAWDSDRADELALGVGSDFGFQRDSSALVVVQRDPDDVYTVLLVEELIPRSAPLVPSATVESFAGMARRYGADTLAADGHYRMTVAEHLERSGLYLTAAPAGAKGKAETYVLLRTLLHEGRIKLPDHERLLRQVRETTSRPLPGGGVSIDSPRWKTGGHGDLVSALVLAIWQASQQAKPERPAEGPARGSVEWHAEQERERKASIIGRQREKQWQDENGNDWILGPEP